VSRLARFKFTFHHGRSSKKSSRSTIALPPKRNAVGNAPSRETKTLQPLNTKTACELLCLAYQSFPSTLIIFINWRRGKFACLNPHHETNDSHALESSTKHGREIGQILPPDHEARRRAVRWLFAASHSRKKHEDEARSSSSTQRSMEICWSLAAHRSLLEEEA